jgi:predicted peroxiredoxin
MSNKAVISLTTGLEDSEKVTVAFLVSVGAAEKGRPALMFLYKEAVPLAVLGFAHALACDACPTLTDLMGRYGQAGGRFLVCPICFEARKIDRATSCPTLNWEAPSPYGVGGADGEATFSY